MVGLTFDPEKFQLNIARLKKGGETFEIVVEPDLAISLREGNTVDIQSILKARKIYADAQKGMLAPVSKFEEIFATTDDLQIAEQILRKGEIHLTAQYKATVRERKRKQVITIIHTNGVDPKTNLPHPLKRIEAACDLAKIKIDEFKTAKDQVQAILKLLQPILPIRFEQKEIRVRIPREYASKTAGILKTFGDVTKSEWAADGSYTGIVVIPGGLAEEFHDKLNALTKGSVQTEIINIKKHGEENNE